MGSQKLAHFSPGRLIFSSILFTIVAGTFLLALPISRTAPVSLIDLFFTATSATCVTGFEIVPVDTFTTFGQLIILLLIQIGGLGLITMTLFLMSFFIDFGFATQLMAGRLLELESWRNIRSFIFFIMGITLIIELLGALCIFFIIMPDYELKQAAFIALFHSVSTFCNAGIALTPHLNFVAYQENYFLLGTFMALMFLGGIGFVTIHETIQFFRSLIQKKRHTFSLHSKIILFVASCIIALGTLIIFALEYNHAFASMGIIQSFVHALFYAFSFRGCGIILTDLSVFQPATLFLSGILAFMGASPISTGSGIKITTAALFIATIKAAIQGKTTIDIKRRRIPKDLIFKAVAVVGISGICIATTFFLLLIIEPKFSFFELYYETVSAFTTLGLSTGITRSLSSLGKIILITAMMVGRIGALTLILALRHSKRNQETAEFSYPEERIIIS